MVLIEHQSTINPNMPLRLLSYITRIYEKLLAGRKSKLYGKKGLTLPRPEFMETHGSEVINMVFDEWRLDEALVVEREEGREEGIEIGIEKGIEEGVLRTARNAFAKGLALDTISDITGLDIDALRQLSAE